MAIYELGELCTWAKGASIPRDDTNPSKSCAYLHYGDLYKKYNFRLNLKDKYSEILKIDNISKIKSEQYLRSGDIVFALTSETVEDLGHCTLIINSFEKPFVSGMETTVIHIKNKKEVSPAYLNYYFHNNHFQNQLRQYVTGMKVYRVHPKDLMKIKIDLPDSPVQELVVSILDAISDKILLNSKINDNLSNQLIVYYQSLEKTKWRNVPAETIFDISIGRTPPRKETHWFSSPDDEESINWVSISDMGKASMFIVRTAETLTKEAVECFNIPIIPENTVILSFKLTIGRVAITDSKMCTNEAIAHFKIKDSRYVEMLYAQLLTYNYEDLGNTSSIATAVNSKTIKSMKLYIPPDDILNEIHHKMSPIVEAIRNNQHQIEKLTEIRDYLLPKLIGGQIEVASTFM